MSSRTGYTFPANASASMVDLEALTAMDARENAGAVASVSTPFKQGTGAYDGGGETTAGGLSALLQQQQQQQQGVHSLRSPLTASPAEPGSAFWQKRGMHTSPVSVLMIPALNLSIETTMDDMDCDDDEARDQAAATLFLARPRGGRGQGAKFYLNSAIFICQRHFITSSPRPTRLRFYFLHHSSA